MELFLLFLVLEMVLTSTSARGEWLKSKRKTPAVCQAAFVKLFLFYFRGSLIVESLVLRFASLLERRHHSVFLVLSYAYS